MKKKLVYSSSFWVVAYTIVYMLLTLLYCLPRILAEFSTVDMLHVNENFTFPLNYFAWGLLVITAGYCGIDRAALAKKSSMMEIGSCDVGDPAKLRRVIYLLCLVFIENLFLNFYLGRPFVLFTDYGKRTFNGIDLPLEGLTSALVSTVVIFVTGNKAIKFTKNIDTTEANEDWANEKTEKVIVEGEVNEEDFGK